MKEPLLIKEDDDEEIKEERGQVKQEGTKFCEICYEDHALSKFIG